MNDKMNVFERLVKIAIDKGFTKEQAEKLATTFTNKINEVF